MLKWFFKSERGSSPISYIPASQCGWVAVRQSILVHVTLGRSSLLGTTRDDNDGDKDQSKKEHFLHNISTLRARQFHNETCAQVCSIFIRWGSHLAVRQPARPVQAAATSSCSCRAKCKWPKYTTYTNDFVPAGLPEISGDHVLYSFMNSSSTGFTALTRHT